MTDTQVFILIGGFVAFGIIMVIVAIVTSIKKEKQRKQEWGLVAKDIGFDFAESNNSLIFRYNFFKSFDTGSSRKTKNVMTGKNGSIDITIMDYQYTTGSGKNKTTHQQTICIFEKEGLGLPRCYLRMQIAFFDFLGKIFGGQDIDFVEDPEFSKSFVLQGEEKEVRRVFNDKVREGFLDYKGKNFIFEGNNDRFLIHKGKRVKPDELMIILEDAYKIIDLFLKNKQA
ncbi:hypothetical protein [Candidatus Uabimicrobium sp. HlEnr_7]|uniref:hypothetical protein n=1 Tax=Candidatus Uabimicrobium helgolandensis TaxID=3095367 RepID=UPI003558D8CA